MDVDLSRSDTVTLPETSKSIIPAPADTTPAAREPFTIISTAGLPEQYAVGARVLVAAGQAWLCRDDDGFYAIDAYCPHRGFLLRPQDGRFLCMCHGSTFEVTGECTSKPAFTGLRYLTVVLDQKGNLAIRRDHPCRPTDRLVVQID